MQDLDVLTYRNSTELNTQCLITHKYSKSPEKKRNHKKNNNVIRTPKTTSRSDQTTSEKGQRSYLYKLHKARGGSRGIPPFILPP